LIAAPLFPFASAVGAEEERLHICARYLGANTKARRAREESGELRRFLPFPRELSIIQ